MTTTINGDTGVDKVQPGVIVPADLSSTFNSLGNYLDDTAAAVGGIAIGQLYRNGSIIMVRTA